MKTKVALLAIALVWNCAGCDLGLGQREARRTVVGISPVQVVRASQRVLAAEGFDLALVYPREGNLRTAWREQPRTRLSYTVSTSPFVDEDGKAVSGALTVAVACTAQDRVVGGWSEEYASGHRTRAILKEITSLLFESPPQTRRTAVPAAPPRAETTARPGPASRPAPAAEPATEAEPTGDGDGDVDAGPAEEEVA
ncbi:MAG TPA: hypothetical protein VM285_15025, partial [Polyangia bacterium]|nr:hypothetical protein [Polyangia bacterium]